MPVSAKRLNKSGRRATAARGLAAVLAAYVSLASGGLLANAQEVGRYAFVDTQALNLRTGPDTGSSIICTIPRRTVVSILERKGVWARVFVQNAGKPAEGWLSTHFLGRNAESVAGRRHLGSGGHIRKPAPSHPSRPRAGPLRISKLDFDCGRPLFGNSGIRNCVASVRVQLSREEYDPDRMDRILIVCRGAISYQTENSLHAKRIVAVERRSISRDDRLGRTVRVDFDVRSSTSKIISAQLRAFSCARD